MYIHTLPDESVDLLGEERQGDVHLVLEASVTCMH